MDILSRGEATFGGIEGKNIPSNVELEMMNFKILHPAIRVKRRRYLCLNNQK
jgi:hypothetical protein